MTVKKKKKGSGLKGLEPYYIIIGIIIILLCLLLIIIKSQNYAVDTADSSVTDGGVEVKSQKDAPSEPSKLEPLTAEPEPPQRIKTEIVQTGPVSSRPPRKPVRRDENVRNENVRVKNRGSLVFVIDDVGNSKEQLKDFLEIPFPVTFAIMPDRKYTRECAAMIKAAGKEYILHQPMEAVGGSDPGKSAILLGMTDAEIKRVLEHNFAQLPDAKGMNNHMGSAGTSDPDVMNSVMEYLAKNDLFFLDSLTISNSLGRETAELNDVMFTKRNSMFLDNENDHESIQNAINEGKKTASKKGHAVMIGHVMTKELADIMLELYPDFIEDGFSLKEISELFVEMNNFEPE